MIASQYRIVLPSNYDMEIIRKRVADNGSKTDGFPGLKFKLYLITQKDINGNMQNMYAPLYVWKDSEGLNRFLFEGFYDNIISSFGWQHVNIGVPLSDTTTDAIKECKYVYEIIKDIEPQESLKHRKEAIELSIPKLDGAQYVVIYNPDKWKYHVFYLIDDQNKVKGMPGVIYEILHVSLG